MDSDDELEPFQITEEDQANEFRPRRRRFRKEDAIYGMWAEQDSDDENRFVCLIYIIIVNLLCIIFLGKTIQEELILYPQINKKMMTMIRMNQILMRRYKYTLYNRYVVIIIYI